jgi:hypothetical protein
LKGGFLMVNQKGQAFSVFELMIAGVVAFAILMVLMQVIGGVLTGQDTDALDALSDAVKSANPSGEQAVGNFVLKKGVSIDQSDLANATDLDLDSFIFEQGAFSDNEITVGDGTYIRYIGSQQRLTLAATVICKPTPEQMEAAIDRLSDDSSTSDFTLGNYSDCPEGLVCCVIIPKKRTN